MKKVWIIAVQCVLCLMLVLPGYVGAVTPTSDFEPEQMPNVLTGDLSDTVGTWFVGKVPNNPDKTKLPIVFVSGMQRTVQDWWQDTVYYGVNDMYRRAYQNGYRTAFAQLYDPEVGAKDQWTNGQILAQILENIYRHYGQKVNVVAHSKGGIDTQTALVHYGASRYVNKVITLGSPHHGTPLADLVFSWYAGWLGKWLGYQHDAVRALQTGSMSHYRSLTDSNPNVRENVYYTMAGNDWGPFLTRIWVGGFYLSHYGENDGLVNTWSTVLPYGHHLGTVGMDHDLIRKGSAIFPLIAPTLRTISTGSASDHFSPRIPKETTGEQWVYGAPLVAGQWETKTMGVDSSVKTMVLSVLTKSRNARVMLISPSGQRYTHENIEYSSEIESKLFGGANLQSYHIASPEPGTWQVWIKSNEEDAYLLTSTFNGESTYEVDLPTQFTGKYVPVSVKLLDPKEYRLNGMNVQMKVVYTDGKNKGTIPAVQSSVLTNKNNPVGMYTGQLQGTARSGVYNVTIEIKGKTKQGEPYERTVIRSIYMGHSDR